MRWSGSWHPCAVSTADLKVRRPDPHRPNRGGRGPTAACGFGLNPRAPSPDGGHWEPWVFTCRAVRLTTASARVSHRPGSGTRRRDSTRPLIFAAARFLPVVAENLRAPGDSTWVTAQAPRRRWSFSGPARSCSASMATARRSLHHCVAANGIRWVSSSTSRPAATRRRCEAAVPGKPALRWSFQACFTRDGMAPLMMFLLIAMGTVRVRSRRWMRTISPCKRPRCRRVMRRWRWRLPKIPEPGNAVASD